MGNEKSFKQNTINKEIISLFYCKNVYYTKHLLP